MEGSRTSTKVSLLIVFFSVFLAVAALQTVIGNPAPGLVANGSDGFQLRAQASYDAVSSNGVDPIAVSLTWAQTGDACFTNYQLQYSTAGSNGPWTTLGTYTSSTNTKELPYNLASGTSYWWQVMDNDCLGSQASNQLQVNLPAAATLSYTQPSSTSAQFAWNNPAAYGGLLKFVSYQLMESISGGSYSSATTVTTVTSTTYTINGLSPGTSYSFYLVTSDGCTCGGSAFSSDSNTVAFTTVNPLAVTANANPLTITAGQSVTLTCAANGGTQSYTSYAWTFGDGTTGSGETVTHAYSSAGTMTATCTVTDSSGSHASSSVTITVNGGLAGLPVSGSDAMTIGIVVVVIVVAVAVAVVILRRRRASPPSPPTQPPQYPPSPPTQ